MVQPVKKVCLTQPTPCVKCMLDIQVSEAKALSSLRDIPPVAGKILWARQMERQLRLLSMRLSDVLGEGWENHVDGRPLKAVCDELLRNLDTQRCVCAVHTVVYGVCFDLCFMGSYRIGPSLSCGV